MADGHVGAVWSGLNLTQAFGISRVLASCKIGVPKSSAGRFVALSVHLQVGDADGIAISPEQCGRVLGPYPFPERPPPQQPDADFGSGKGQNQSALDCKVRSPTHYSLLARLKDSYRSKPTARSLTSEPIGDNPLSEEVKEGGLALPEWSAMEHSLEFRG